MQNAFGEVQHGLIDAMLMCHHISVHVIEIVDALYADFKVTITTRDCLSTLLCMNSLIRILQTKEFEQVSCRSNRLLTPRNWFQFADDAIAISATEYEIKPLLMLFQGGAIELR